MKKLLTAIISAAMMASLFIPTASAAAADRTFVQVKYATEGLITIDGNVTESEWDETSKLVLSATGTGASQLKKWTANDVADIQFYYSWGDKGLYMAAKVIDTTPVGLAPNEDGFIDPGLRGTADHFQIGLNPMGLISPEASGLFFSFVRLATEEGATSGDVLPVAHYWAEGIDNDADDPQEFNKGSLEGYGADYEGKYTVTSDGWNMELLLPFDLIASELRTYDLDVDVDSVNSLTMFDPKGENRALAWASAMIAYVDCELQTAEDGTESGQVIGTGRTVLEGIEDPTSWRTVAYPLALKFNLQNQTPDESTETLEPTVTDAVTIPEGDTYGPEVGDDTDPEEDTAKTTDKAVDTTTPAGDDGDGAGLPTGAIIGIVAAVVVVIAAIVAVVLKKKK